jgi:hypothetical protein
LVVTRGLGASILSCRIWDAVTAAGEGGLTVVEIYDRIKDIPGFASDTHRWWIEISTADRPSVDIFDGKAAGLARVRKRVDSLRTHGQLISQGHAGRGKSRYVAGKPPRGYRAKWVKQLPWGWYEFDTAAEKSAGDRERQVRTWLEKARVELKRTHSRQWRTLVEDAVKLLER